MQRAVLDRLIADRAAMRPVAAITELGGGAQGLLYLDGSTFGESFAAEVVDAARGALASDQSGPVESGGRTFFIHIHNPPLRLAVVGAVHITQALA